MKFKSFFVFLFLIFCSISLTFLMLSWNEQGWTSIVTLIPFIGALIYLLLSNDYSPLFAILIFANHIIFFPGATVSRIALFVIISITLMISSLIEKPHYYKSFLLSVLPLICYMIFNFIHNPGKIRFEWYILYMEAVSFFIFTQFVSWDVKKIQDVILLHLVLIILYGIFEYCTTEITRIKGPMQSATAFGVILVTLWSTWFSIEFFSKKPNIFMITLITVSSFMVMIWTGTRMSFVGIVFTCFIILIFKFQTSPVNFSKKVWMTVSSSLVVFLLLFMIWTILPDNLVIKSGFDSILKGEIDVSNMGRIVAWWIAFKAFLAYPVFGIGNGNFSEFMKDYYLELNIPETGTELFLLPHAHNIPLTILSENGILGFLVALLILITCIISIVTKIKISKDNRIYGLLTGLCVMLLLGMFDAIPYFPSTQIWGAWFLAVIIQFKTDISKSKVENCSI